MPLSIRLGYARNLCQLWLATLAGASACSKPAALAEKPPLQPAPAPTPVDLPNPHAEIDALCAPPKHSYPGDPMGTWVRGPHSRLCAAQTEEARHDRSYGKTLLIFDSDAADGARTQHEHEGLYHIFGYSAAAHAFVVGPAFESGAAVFVEAVGLVDDRDGTLRWSKYRPLHMTTAVLSPGGEALALIASPGEHAYDGHALWLYRITSDELFRLGPPPAPPPIDDEECNGSLPIRWVDMERNEGYETMDPGVITFHDETHLVVSYGKDTCKARAKQRRTRSWDLAQLKHPRPAPRPSAEDR